MNTRVAIVISIAVLILSMPAWSAVIHVSTSGDDAHDGLTWESAKRTVQAGITAAQSGDEVWVAKGTYVENIVLKDGVGLYGGFDGTESELSQRDLQANETILDGNQAGSVVTCIDASSENTKIDGFTIGNGIGTLDDDILSGGGIYCVDSTLSIVHCVITENSAQHGAGVFLSASSVLIERCIIHTNVIAADLLRGRGVGVYSTYSNLSIQCSHLQNNRTTS